MKGKDNGKNLCVKFEEKGKEENDRVITSRADANMMYSLLLQHQTSMFDRMMDEIRDLKVQIGKLRGQQSGGSSDDVYRPSPPDPSLRVEDNDNEYSDGDKNEDNDEESGGE